MIVNQFTEYILLLKDSIATFLINVYVSCMNTYLYLFGSSCLKLIVYSSLLWFKQVSVGV